MDPADRPARIPFSVRARGPWSVLFSLAGVALVVVAAFLVFGGSSGVFNKTLTYPSLRVHHDASISGTVAVAALGEGTPTGKQSCVEAVAAGGGTLVRLFFVKWRKDKTMTSALRWLPDGHLDVTSRDSNDWRNLVDVATGVVTDVAWATPSNTSTGVGSHGQMVESRVSLGTLRLTMTTGGAKRTLLSVAVPSEYSLSGPAWRVSDAWLAVVDSAARIHVLTCASTPPERVLTDSEGPAVTGRTFARLALSS